MYFYSEEMLPSHNFIISFSFSGEVLGELLSIINNPEGLKQLTNLPRGTAEMELMSLLPIYYVYHYLDKTEKWDILGKESAASEKELKRKMQAGGMFVSVEKNTFFSLSHFLYIMFF